MQVGSVSFAALFFCLFVGFFSHSCHRNLENPGNPPKIMSHENFAAHDIYLGLSQNKHETGKEPIARGTKGG